MSAGFTQAVSLGGGFKAMGLEDGAKDWEGLSKNAIAAGVIGGTSSVIGGGKFANGAITGAMSRLLNDCAHGCLKEEQQKSKGTRGQMGRRQLFKQDNDVLSNFDLSIDGQLCAGPCIGGEFEVSKFYGTSTTLKSGFGIKASAGGGSDISVLTIGDTPQNGDLSTVNFLSGQFGPLGLTVNNYAWPSGSQWSFEFNLRYPGGFGVNGGTGIKRW